MLDLFSGKTGNFVPFWEVWFCMFDFCNRHYGSYDIIENRIKMALDLGMDAIILDFIDTNVHFGQNSTDTTGISHYQNGTLQSLEQLAEKPLPDWSNCTKKLMSDRKKVAAAGLLCSIYLPHCFHSANISMGLENLAMRLYDDPDFVKKYLQWVEGRNCIAIDEVILKAQPDFVLFDGDCCYKSGMMIDPQLYRDLTFDLTKNTVARLKKLNIHYAFHSDGKADDLLPMLIELGFSAFHGCEKQANDLEHLVEKFGDSICLVGNMDVVFLKNASPDEIKSETQKTIKTGRKKGKFIISCNTSPQDYIPDQNYLTFSQTIKENKL